MMRQLAIALCCIVVACAAEVKLARQQVAGARNGATYSASTRQAMVPGRFNGGFADFNGPYVNGYFGRAPFGGVQPPFGFNPVTRTGFGIGGGYPYMGLNPMAGQVGGAVISNIPWSSIVQDKLNRESLMGMSSPYVGQQIYTASSMTAPAAAVAGAFPAYAPSRIGAQPIGFGFGQAPMFNGAMRGGAFYGGQPNMMGVMGQQLYRRKK